MTKRKKSAQTAAPSQSMPSKNRVTKLAMVLREDVIPNPKNFRRHPGDQLDMLSASIKELGFCDPLIVRQTEDGKYMLIDGEARWQMAGPGQKIPAVILDLNPEEADKLLSIRDVIGSFAVIDQEALGRLSGEIEFDQTLLTSMLDAFNVGPKKADLSSKGKEIEEPTLEHECPRCGFKW